MLYRAEIARQTRDPSYRRRWLRGQAQMEAAFQQFDGMARSGQIAWLFDFVKRDLPIPRAERVALGYQLRGLAQIVGFGWRWRGLLEPIPDRSIRRVHSALRTGLRALEVSSTADFAEPVGWRLPTHRTWLRRIPAPLDNRHARTPLSEGYEAANETSGIVAAIGHFLRRNDSLWRSCECGCGERFITERKKKFIDQRHQNRTSQKRSYNKWKEKNQLLRGLAESKTAARATKAIRGNQ